jgi:DNA-binding NtrC family response regulator
LAETASHDRAGPLIVVNAPSLGKNRQVVLERIKQKSYGTLQDHDRLRWESRRGSIVFEDIDRAHVATQETIRELLDHMMGEASCEKRDLFPLRKSLFIAGPDLQQLVRANQFSSPLFAQVSAFEIQCPPLRERQHEHDAILEITEQRVCEALRIEGFHLTTEEKAEVYSGAWDANFWDLYRYVVRCAIGRGSN